MIAVSLKTGLPIRNHPHFKIPVITRLVKDGDDWEVISEIRRVYIEKLPSIENSPMTLINSYISFMNARNREEDPDPLEDPLLIDGMHDFDPNI